MAWDSPWGRGRPGWHIECSAMATQLLGEQLDIHCGGIDNIFPHHEAEIAQTEGVTGKKFVGYWMHCAHLLVDGQKMSKSLGNFYTLRDVLERGYTGREMRYALLRVHYRSPLNFTWEGLEEARQALGRIDDWLIRLRETAGEGGDNGPDAPADGFGEALDDDLNISGALGVLFENIRDTNRLMDQSKLEAVAARNWFRWWKQADSVLQIEPQTAALAPPDVQQLVDERQQARLAKDWGHSDELRRHILALGWEVRDTKEGQKVNPASGTE